MKKLIISFSLCLCVVSLVFAQPQISGPLSGTMGPGTYIVVGNCSVSAANTLTLEPGTTFLFAGHYNITINSYGTLHAVGTRQDSIVFTRQYPDTSCEWSGIRFEYGASANSILSYCRLEYAKHNVSPNHNGGALYIQGAAITISHCTIANNYATGGGGIYVNVSAITVSDCVFMNNSSGNGGGLYIKWSSGVTVNNCIFARNSSTNT
ncbi:MAG: right-handed parallel beta-helix repeat-containing protein [Planctomycetota bacterium]|jgi:predicted outer membrane repeat protein